MGKMTESNTLKFFIDAQWGSNFIHTLRNGSFLFYFKTIVSLWKRRQKKTKNETIVLKNDRFQKQPFLKS